MNRTTHSVVRTRLLPQQEVYVTVKRHATSLLKAAIKTGGAKLASKKAVTFSCDNTACVVRMTIRNNTFVFSGTGGTVLPEGTHDAFYAVRPAGETFEITAQGASMDPIVNSSNGIRELEV
jgi:hypothetical protein